MANSLIYIFLEYFICLASIDYFFCLHHLSEGVCVQSTHLWKSSLFNVTEFTDTSLIALPG